MATCSTTRPGNGAVPGGRILLAVVALCLVISCSGAENRSPEAAPQGPLTVVFLGNGTRESLDAEESAALAWLQAEPSLRARYLQIADLASTRMAADDIIWWHYATRPELPSSALDTGALAALRSHLESGGGLLLTLFATPYTVPLGLEKRAPDHVAAVDGTAFARWGPEDDRILDGFQSFAGHPLLRRFWGGTYTATPVAGHTYPVAVYAKGTWPEQGRVIAVRKRTIGIVPTVKSVIEYPSASSGMAGRALTIGEGIYFGDAGNRNRVQLELLVRDAIEYLAGRLPPAPSGAAIPSTGAPAVSPKTALATGAGSQAAPPPATRDRQESPSPPLPPLLRDTTYWKAREHGVIPFEVPRADEPATESDLSGVLEALSAADSGLALEATGDPRVAFDLSGPRALLTGRQDGRIEELWSPPYRVLRDLRFGIARQGQPTVWLDQAGPPEFVARPEGDTFQYEIGGVEVSLHVAVPREEGGAVIVVATDASDPLELTASFVPGHEPMWPREADHLGPLMLGWDPSAQAAVWTDPEQRLSVYAGFGQAGDKATLGTQPSPPEPPDQQVPAPSRTRSSIRTRLVPASGGITTFAVAVVPGGPAAARQRFRALASDPVAVWTTNANYYRELLEDTLDISTPDPTFNEAFRWAKVEIDAFRVTTPGLGTGLAAGYASSADERTDTWAADNDFLRRPGYGWYFGRDSIWTAFAADAYGGGDLASEALRLLARYQDVDGKIFHEMSPSWAIHYDAADSTPLFLLGLEHHVRTTGDRELLRLLWPAVRRAMAFLHSTDTDGDGLIENTGVGHGWIEGGRFYGAHTTFYLAGIWAATLRAVERMARWISDDQLAASSKAALAPVQEALARDFWDDAHRTWFYGKRADGTYMPLRTIMPAVPLLLGVLPETHAAPVVRWFADADVTADWGTRMTARSDPDYDPRGYHEGMVWPLFSGWTSLAAYRTHRPWSAWVPLAANFRLHRFGSLGTVPEALDGERLESAGVTSHQAWSEAMVILPAVEGLLGIHADAIGGALRVHPHLPGGWSEVVIRKLRLGDGLFRITIQRGREASRFLIERLAGTQPTQFELSLPFPRSVLVNLDRDATRGIAIRQGERIIDHPTEKEALARGTLTDATAVVTFRHSPFPEVVPPASPLVPGARSSSLRVLEATYRGGAEIIQLEGLPGHRYRLQLSTPWPIARVTGLSGVRVVNRGPGRATLEFELKGNVHQMQSAEITVEFRR